MPLYEYECQSCGHRFEKIQKFSDPPVDKCPKCGGVVQKLMSSPAIKFKGAGWYVNDYGKKTSSDSSETKSGKSDKSDKPDKPAEKSGGDTKPASSSSSESSKSDK